MSRIDEMNTIRTLVSIVESRDPNLSGHSVHTERLAILLYNALPFRLRLKINKKKLQYAALLHDIGQVGVPADTLSKSGKLNDEERAQMKQHPEISVAILSRIGGYDKILKAVRFHHERMDGKGYYGLAGSEVPYISRILAIVDTFSSVTVSKSYKPTRPYEDGISILKLGAGSQFDEELVEYFCSISRISVESCAAEMREEVDWVSNSVRMMRDH